MTEFAHAVNFTMSFGCNVLPDDINKMRERLEASDNTESLFHLEISKDSTDEEIADYLGVENYRDWMLSEVMDLEMEEHHEYDVEDTQRIIKQYQDQVKTFKEANKETKT